MKIIEKYFPYCLYLFVFLLPLQTRLIVRQGMIGDIPWEYGTISLYATEVFLLLLIIAGLMLGFSKRREDGVHSRRLLPFYFALAGVVLWSLLSLFWSANQALAFTQWIHLVEGFLLLIVISINRFSYRGVGWAFVLSGTVQGILGIVQFMNQKVVGSTILGMSSQISHAAGASVIQSGEFRWLRAYGTLPHPNILAAFLACALIIGITLIITSSSYKERAALWGMQTIMFGSLFFTFSKSGLLALVIGVIFLYLFILLLKDYEGKLLFTQFIFLCITVLGLLAMLYPDPVFTRAQAQQPLEIQSVTERLTYVQQAQAIIAQHPIRGIGLGNYTVALQGIAPRLAGWDYQPVHTVYLLILSELGVIGVLFFVLFLGEAIRALYSYKIDYQIELMQVFKESSSAGDELNLYSEYSFSVHWFLCYAAIFLMMLSFFFFDHFLWTLYVGVVFFWLTVALWIKQIGIMKR